MGTSCSDAARPPLRGRDADFAALSDLLIRRCRLVTVTGAAGCGKTRLALDVADRHRDEFPHGVVVAMLSTVTDAVDVPRALCRALGLVVPDDTTVVERLQHILRRRRTLLVIDNFEHVIGAAPTVAALSRHCRDVTFVVTSRRPLRVVGEHVVHLRPLAVPSPDDDPETAMGSPAVQMFCDHARAVASGFAATPTVVSEVAEICRRLDGLPLAIEIAAARSGLLSPAVVLDQLAGTGPLALLDDRDHPSKRRHSLRATVQWSYQLLQQPATANLFRRLSVFRGPYTLDSAQAVCADNADIFDAHAELVDLHLVEPGSDGHFHMPRTIKDFAQDLVDVHGEYHELASRHARYYLDLARQAGAGLETHREQQWGAQVDAQQLEILSALDWLRCHDRLTDAVEAAGWLGPFWLNRGQLADGRRHLNAQGANELPQARGWAVRLALESGQGTLNRVDTAHVIDALRAVCDDLRDQTHSAAWLRSCEHLSYALRSFGEPEQAMEVVDNALAACTTSADEWWRAELLHRAALLAQQVGRDSDAATLAGDCYQVAVQSSNQRIAARAQQILAITDTPDPDEMIAQLESVLAASTGLGDHRGSVATTALLGAVTSAQSANRAAQWFDQTISSGRRIGYWHGTALGVAGIIALAADTGEWASAAKLHGGLIDHLDLLACQMSPAMVTAYNASVQHARRKLGENAFRAATSEGAQWTWDELMQRGLDLCHVVERVSDLETSARHQDAASVRAPSPVLTPREIDVLRLITRGHTNKEIAAALTMSPKTVEHHTSHIYRKLGVRGRIEAINHANEHHLLDEPPDAARTRR
ncbi:LuxR C-terminal-related transcriptional regulator [Mycobacterium marinum]|uniref:LuxR C-terminal-related transcriptional regulator n=1 Tax=Mycobacterium marinum TaxID=1781 RepID=UPI00356235D4